jgi:hypothetical protein
LGEPLVIIGIFEHCALGFGIVHPLRESATPAITMLTPRSDGRRSKSAKARNRGDG